MDFVDSERNILLIFDDECIYIIIYLCVCVCVY